MTKGKQLEQQSQSEDKVLLPHEEPITTDLLFRSQNLTQKIISQVIEHNNEEFGDVDVADPQARSSNVGYARKRVKASDVFVDARETYRERKKTQWTNATKNKRSDKFYSLDSLVKNEVIAEEEKDFFELPPGVKDFPYRQIYYIKRLKKVDGTEWISTLEQWFGLSAQAAVVTCPVDDQFWYLKPKISYELRTIDGAILPQGSNISDIKTKKVAIIKNTGYLGEYVGEGIYTHPWSEEIFRSILKMARGQVGDSHNGCTLTLVREGEPHSGAVVKSVEDFILPFKEIYNRLTAREQIIKFNPQDLKNLTSGAQVKENPYQ
jgi:hypothetical protein